MEIEEAAFLREQESEFSAGIYIGNLAQGLVLGIVVGLLGAPLALLFQVEQPARLSEKPR